MLAAILIGLGVFAIALAALVLRNERGRTDSKAYAVMGMTDGFAMIARGVMVLDGAKLTDPNVLLAATSAAVILGYYSIVFAYSFPFDRKVPRAVRVPLAIWSVAAFILTASAYGPELHPYLSYGYFLPIFVTMIVLLFRSYHLTRASAGRATGGSAGIPLVIAAFVFRWSVAMFTWTVAHPLDERLFEIMLAIECTAGVAIGYVMIGYAILRYRMFRVRGVIAEGIVYGGLGMAAVALTVLAVDLVLRAPMGPLLQRAVLAAIAFLPAALWWGVRALGAKLEHILVCPLDPRRAELQGLLEAMVHTTSEATPDALRAAARDALVEATDGGRVRFLWAPETRPPDGAGDEEGVLPPAFAAHLATLDAPYVHRPHAHGLSVEARAELDSIAGDVFVPVRKGGVIFGAFALEAGRVDRDVVQTSVALAEHLALKLQNFSLFDRMLRLEKELEESRRLASLGSFAAAIAHDIRTPLTSVQMNVQILKGKVDLPADDMEYFDIALDELKRLNLHINEILDFAKPVQLQRGPIDAAAIADEAARALEPVVAERSLRIEREHAEGLPKVLGDGHRLRQVLQNLLENAAQASSPGAAIRVRLRRADAGQVAIEVTDSGRGITAEQLPKIFEPFYTTRPDGTGLGLAIVRKIVRAHGGEVRVESSPGRGAAFTVLLPAAAPA